MESKHARIVNGAGPYRETEGGLSVRTPQRADRRRRLSEFGTSLDSASATGTNRDQLVIQLLPQAVPAGALPAPHAFDGRYSNVENRLASPPDRLWSRIRCGRDTRGESCRSVALRRGAKAARKEQS